MKHFKVNRVSHSEFQPMYSDSPKGPWSNFKDDSGNVVKFSSEKDAHQFINKNRTHDSGDNEKEVPVV